MTIPFISNVAFTEVDSAGNLNTKAGTTKSKLPIQIFKLTDNITGNLTLDSNAIHKKIILDTNGNTITNATGSPLTINSSIPLEIKGSGNIQSHDLTFESTESDTSYTGTTTIADADDSTVVVTAFNRDADISQSGGVSVASGFVDSMSGSNPFYFPVTELLTLPANPGSNDGGLSGGAAEACLALSTIAGGSSMPNIGGAGFSVTVNGVTYTSTTSTGTNEKRFGLLTFQNFAGGVRIFGHIGGSALSVSALKIPNNTVVNGGRRLVFTNNLAIPVALSRTDPFAVTVAAGATNTQERLTTDGSFDILGTITGNDGSNQPYALQPVNNGSQSSLVTTAYTGTFSASAF
tara:strand:- start:7009 stop:8055 length:1047 start_codon:yes stop_codon:yes gene_type:complete